MTGEYKAKEDAPTNSSEVKAVKGFAARAAKLVKRDVVPLTPDFATHILEGLVEFRDDRTLNSIHVDYLVRTMERGTFVPELVQIIICVVGDVEYRMNGQHTAWATILHDKPVGDVHVLKYEASSMDEMAKLYTSIDRGKERSKQFVVAGYLGGDPEFSDLPKGIRTVLAHGFTQYRWGYDGGRRRDGDEIGALMRGEYRDLSIKVGKFLHSVEHSDFMHLRRASVIAVMYATFAHRPNLSNEFWSRVANGVGFTSPTDPRLVLRNWLLNISVDHARGAGGANGRRAVAILDINWACRLMWNHWREGTSVKFVRVPKSKPTLI